MFPMGTKDLMSLPNSMEGICSSTLPSNSLLFSLYTLKDKLNQVTSTSTTFTCQQMALSFPQGTTSIKRTNEEIQKQQSNIQSNFGNNDTSIDLRGQSIFSNNDSEPLEWFGESYNSNINYRLKGDIDDHRGDREIWVVLYLGRPRM